MFSLPRLQPPPPLCDCLKPPTRLERLIWWLSRRCRKKHRVVFDRVVVPNIRKGWQDTPDLRDILSSDSLKSNAQVERCANSAYAPTPCSALSPTTGQLCTMGKGHFGPHKVGGPYHTVETFVTQCTDKPCVYHPNSREVNKAGSRVRWEECIHCGHIIEPNAEHDTRH